MIIVSRILDVRPNTRREKREKRGGEGECGNPIEFASVAISNGSLDYVHADSSAYTQLLS